MALNFDSYSVLKISVIVSIIIATTFGQYDVEYSTAVFKFLDAISSHKTTRPVSNVSETLNVNATWNLVSILDFDEANGYIEVSGYFNLVWTASAYLDALNTNNYNGTEQIKNTDIWKPPIILVNSLKYFDEVGSDSNIRVEYNFQTHTCSWKPWLITKVACSPNVQYYPFDKQSCKLKISIWGYNSSEVKLQPQTSDWSFDFFEENGEWTVSNTMVEASDIGGISTIDFKVDLIRRPLYYIVNLLAPVILLGLLNSFTFLLPIASGERIGFSVTCFLAYVVLLNTIMLYLPTSTPFSNLGYYTFIMMLFSAGVCLVTIITVRIHFKDEGSKVPSKIAALFRCLMCKCCGDSVSQVHLKNNVVTITNEWDDDDVDDIDSGIARNTDATSISTIETETEMKWSEIAAFFDTLMFFGFLAGQIIFSIGYLVPLILGGDQ